MRNGLITLAAGALMLCAAPGAAAQSGAYINLMRTQNQQMMNRVRIYSTARSGARITRYGGSKSARGRAGGGSGTPGTSRPAPPAGGRPAAPPAASTTFRFVATSIMPQEMAGEIARTPDERAKLEKLFGELLSIYRDRLRQAGGSQNDVARAASYLVSSSYAVYYDAELSEAQFDALREHLREGFATDDKFLRASDRERQKMFETFAIVGNWINVGFGTGKERGDRAEVQKWRGIARANLENMLGAPPEKVQFTTNGVEYR